MKKIFLFILFALTPLYITAETVVNIREGFTINIPNEFKQIQTDKFVYHGKKDNATQLYILFSRIGDADQAAYNAFNLTKYIIQDVKEEKLWEIGKKYCYLYLQDEQGHKIATYAAETGEKPFVILFTYANEEDLQIFQNIVDSQNYKNMKWSKRFGYIFVTSIGFLILLLFLLIVLNAICENTSITIVSYAAAAIYITAMLWGEWGIIAIIAGIYIAVGAFTAWIHSL